MKIYVGHSSGFNFKEELYKPLRESELNTKHKIVLPHEDSSEPFNSKEFLQNCDLMIAEVSFPSTGLGIELGWANFLGVPILFVYKKGARVSGSLKVVSDKFIEYETQEALIAKLQTHKLFED